MERLLTVDEVAQLLKVKSDTVRGWLRNGTLQGRKIGRIWRIAENDVNKLGQDPTAVRESS